MEMDLGRHMMVTGGRGNRRYPTAFIFCHVFHEFPTVSTRSTETMPVIYMPPEYHRVFGKWIKQIALSRPLINVLDKEL